MDPAVVSLFSWRRLAQGVAGTVIAVGLGVLLIAAPFLGSGGAAQTAVAVLLGGVLVLFGVAIGVGVALALAVTVVVDEVGIRWQSRVRPWELPWTDLRGAGMRTGFVWSLRRNLALRRRKAWRVHLELVLADESYAARHPRMAHLQRPFVGGGPDRYGIPLAQRRELVAPLDAALRRFAGPAYVPVREDGELRPGRGYQPPSAD